MGQSELHMVLIDGLLNLRTAHDHHLINYPNNKCPTKLTYARDLGLLGDGTRRLSDPFPLAENLKHCIIIIEH